MEIAAAVLPGVKQAFPPMADSLLITMVFLMG